MNHQAVGSRLNQHDCTFTVWAPLKEKVELILEQGKSRHMMTKDEFGYWRVSVEDVKAGTEYFFELDGDKKLPDPASRAQPKGVHGPSAVVSGSFPWTDHAWRGLPLGEMIIYELHVASFTPAGTFEGIVTKLKYLNQLGVNTIELMPVAQFPGERNWGYDGVYPFAVQDSYGGVSGLKKLVNEAHNAGIAVVLDVVYNHQGPEGNYLGEYAPYFTDKYKTGWGQALNFDDAWCDGVRNFYLQNAHMWLDEFHIDGLRLDAVHAIWDFSAHHFIEALSGRIRTLEENSGQHKVLIAEFDLNNPRYILPESKGGYGLDGQWIDEFHHALHTLLTGEKDGYYEDFGATEHLAKSLSDAYVYTGQFSVHRKKHFGKEPKHASFDQFVVFAQNHDQTGNRMLGDRLSTLTSFEGLKLAAATYLLSPYVPMLFMGEEYGERRPFQYFISHTDTKLVELVRKGRKAEFSYFKWEGEVPDPQSEKTFKECILSWDVDLKAESQTLFAFYKHLIEFRKRRPAFRGMTRETLKIISGDNGIVSFERNHAGDYVLVVLNFNKETYPVPLPEKDLCLIFNSADASWAGPIATETRADTPRQAIEIHPQSAMIFEK